MKHIYRFLFLLFVVIITYDNGFSQDFWQKLNGPYTTSVSQLISKSLSKIIIRNTLGLFYTIDTGKTWIKMKIPKKEVLAPIYQTPTGNILLCGSSRVYLSTDNGNIWQIKYDNGAQTINGSCFLEDAEGNILLSGRLGILVSNDGGETWHFKNSGLMETIPNIFSLEKDSLTGIFAAAYKGIYYSKDSHSNWEKLNNPLDTLNGEYGTSLKMNNGRLFLGTNFGRIFYSDYNGYKWKESKKEDTYNVLAFAKTKENTLLSSIFLMGLYASNDNGETWHSAGLPGDIINSIYLYNDGIIIAGTVRRGVCISYDNGFTWKTMNKGLYPYRSGSIQINDKNWIFSGVKDGGMFRSEDGGLSFKQINNGLNYPTVMSILLAGNKKIWTGTGSGIYCSTDDGDSWSLKSNGIKYDGCNIYSIFEVSPGILLAGTLSDDIAGTWSTRGTIISTNDGENWQETSIQLTALSIAMNSKGYIYIGARNLLTTEAGMYVTKDTGKTWYPCGLYGVSDIYSLVIKDDIIYAGADERGIYKSTDDGTNWQEMNNGLTNKRVRSLVINKKGDLFAGTWKGGVFISKDGANSWYRVNSGLVSLSDSLSIHCMCVDSSGYVYLSLGGGGVFRSMETTVSAGYLQKSEPDNYTIMQNYPNPFNPYTIISYTIETQNATHVQIKVYDVLGREIRTLFTGKKAPGKHNILFDGTNLSSGVYFCRLGIRNDKGETIFRQIQMVLIK
jgi:photosystem II stability/assembly factor-like uncharacterized protein